MKAKITFLTILISLAVSILTIGYLHAAGNPEKEQPEQCLIDAWAAFNQYGSKGYENAIKFADKCIDDFGKEASKKQDEQEKNGIQPPPTGKVTDPEKHKINQQGLLNDVATAYFIKGRSAEYLYKEGGAKSAAYRAEAE